MLTIVPIAAIVSLLTLGPAIWRLRNTLRPTALRPAWPWVCLAWMATLAVLPLETSQNWPTGTVGLGWYAAAVVALAPGIAALGARWPTARVWNLFVVVPLLAVFAWPIAVPALRGSRLEAWQLEEPMVPAYALVLLMGAGNYLGTRKTLAALALMTGWLLAVCSACPAFVPRGLSATSLRGLAAVCLGLAPLLVPRFPPPNRPAPRSIAGWQPLLREFHELFGMVWTRRLQERFQAQVNQAGIPVMWSWKGLEQFPNATADSSPSPNLPRTTTDPPPHFAGEPVPGDPSLLTSTQFASVDQMLRWLLAKHVDAAWIEARIDSPPEGDAKGPAHPSR